MLVEKKMSDLERIQEIGRKVGGRTAGQVVEAVLAQKSIGFNLNVYGIDYIQKESLPLWEICHKGEANSPSIDWDKLLYGAIAAPATTPVKDTPVAHIRH